MSACGFARQVGEPTTRLYHGPPPPPFPTSRSALGSRARPPARHRIAVIFDPMPINSAENTKNAGLARLRVHAAGGRAHHPHISRSISPAPFPTWRSALGRRATPPPAAANIANPCVFIVYNLILDAVRPVLGCGCSAALSANIASTAPPVSSLDENDGRRSCYDNRIPTYAHRWP